MSKKLIVVFASFIFLSGFRVAWADVVINEVAWMGTQNSQYEEWVELRNTGSESVSLSGWKLYKNNGTLLFSLSGTIPASSYFIVCRTTPSIQNPLSGDCDEQGTFGGSGLNNTNDVIQLKNSNEAEVDAVDAAGGWPAGDSTTKETMQWNGSSWITSAPTPGFTNSASSTSDNDEEDTSSDSEDADGNDEKKSSAASAPTKKEVKPKVQITSTKLALAGVAFTFEGTGTDIYGEKISHGRYFWNFGDGDSREVKVAITEKFTHTYFYAGDYTVVFEHYPDHFAEVPDATAEITIKVIEPKVMISRVGDASDFFIEISNVTGHNADISSWVLLSDYKIFTFPRNTILAPNKKMIISSKVSNFSVEDKNSLKLMTPQRETVFDYALSGTLASQTNAVPKNKTPRAKEQPAQPEFLNSMEGEDVSLAGSLSALASQNPVLDNDAESLYSSWIIYVSGLIFIGLAAFGVYYIRQKRVPVEAGGDFKILDE